MMKKANSIKAALCLLSTLALSLGAQAQTATDLQALNITYWQKGESLTSASYKASGLYDNNYLYLYSDNDNKYSGLVNNANDEEKSFPYYGTIGESRISDLKYTKTFKIAQNDALAIRIGNGVTHAKLAVIIEGEANSQLLISTSTGENINTGAQSIATLAANGDRAMGVYDITPNRYVWLKAQNGADVKLVGYILWCKWSASMFSNNDNVSYVKNAGEVISLSDVMTGSEPRLRMAYNFFYNGTQYSSDTGGFVWDFTDNTNGNPSKAVFVIPDASADYFEYVDDTHKSVRVKQAITGTATLQLSYPEHLIDRWNLKDELSIVYSVYWPGGTLDLNVSTPASVDYSGLVAFDDSWNVLCQNGNSFTTSGLYQSNQFAFYSTSTNEHLVQVSNNNETSSYFDGLEYYGYQKVLRLEANEAIGFQLTTGKTEAAAKVVVTYVAPESNHLIVKQTATKDFTATAVSSESQAGVGTEIYNRVRKTFDITPGNTVWLTTDNGVDIVSFAIVYSWDGSGSRTVKVESTDEFDLDALLQDLKFNVGYKNHRHGESGEADREASVLLPQGIAFTIPTESNKITADGRNIRVTGLDGSQSIQLTVPAFLSGNVLVPPFTATLTLSSVTADKTPFGTGKTYVAYDYCVRRSGKDVGVLPANSYVTASGGYNVAYNYGPLQEAGAPFIDVTYADGTKVTNCGTYSFTNRDGFTQDGFAIKAKQYVHGKPQRSIVRVHYAGDLGSAIQIRVGDDFTNPERTYSQGATGTMNGTKRVEDIFEVDIEGGKTIWFCAERGTVNIAAYEVFVYHREHFGTLVDHAGDPNITDDSKGHAWTNWNNETCTGYDNLVITLSPETRMANTTVLAQLQAAGKIEASGSFIAQVRSDYTMGKTYTDGADAAWDSSSDDRHYLPDYSEFRYEVKPGDEAYLRVDEVTGQISLLEDFSDDEDGKTIYIVLPEALFKDVPTLDSHYPTTDPDDGKMFYHPTMKRAVTIKMEQSENGSWADVYMYKEGNAIADGTRVTYIHKDGTNKDIEIPTFKAFLRLAKLYGSQANAFGYWGNQPAAVDGSKFANAEVGDKIFITIDDCRTQSFTHTVTNPVTGTTTDVTETGHPAYRLVSGTNSNLVFTGGYVDLDDGQTLIEYTIPDDETLAQMQVGGIKLEGAFFRLVAATLNKKDALPDTFTEDSTDKNCWRFEVTSLNGTPWKPTPSYVASTWPTHGTMTMPSAVTYHEHREFNVEVTYANPSYNNASISYVLVLPKDPRGSYMWSIGADAKLIVGSDILTTEQIAAGVSACGEYYISSAWPARMAVLFSEGVEVNKAYPYTDKGRYYIRYTISDVPDFSNSATMITGNDKDYKVGGSSPTLANPWTNTTTSITGTYREEIAIKPQKNGNVYSAMTRYLKIEVEPIAEVAQADRLTDAEQKDSNFPAPTAGRPTGKWTGVFTFHFIAPPYMRVDYKDDNNKTGNNATTLKYNGAQVWYDGDDVAVPLDWVMDRNTYHATRGKVVMISSSNNQEAIYFSKTGQEPLDPNDPGVLHYSENTSGSGNNTHYETKTSGLFFATEFVETPKEFYTGEYDNDGNRLTSTTMSVMSNLLNVVIYDPKVFYVGEPNDTDKEEVANTDWSKPKTTTFDYTPLTNINFDSTAKPTGSYEEADWSNTGATITQTSMHILFGTDGIYHFRDMGGSHKNGFIKGGLIWKRSSSDQDRGFDEYIDAYQNQWSAAHGSDYNEGDTPKQGTANPYTEVNGMIGGPYTEDGGRFLQPVSGDFIRVEPEYDGVVSLWLRQNGAAENAYRKNGSILRRPVYFVDEDGVVMKRTEYKPTGDRYFCVNGVYGVVSQRAKFRSDFSESWYTGITHWNAADNQDGSTHVLEDRSRDVYRLYGMWYPQFSFTETGSGNNLHVDFGATSQIGRYNKMGEPVYRSEWLFDQEANYNIDQYSFAKYGWEVPNFNYVRYRFPVKAGKSYYIGGRGTKNGFVAVKFEPLKANYEPDKFAKAGENFILSEDDRYYQGDVTQSSNYIELTTSSYDQMPDASNPNLVYHKKAIYDSYATATLAGWSGYTDDTSDIYNIPGTNTGNTNPTYNLSENAEESNLTWMTTLDTQIKNSDNQHSKYRTITVRVGRTFTAGKWHPIVLPFSVSETRMKEIFGDEVAVIYLDPYSHSFVDNNSDYQSVAQPAIDGSELRFTRHYYQMLYAGMPAFIRPAGKVKNSSGKMVPVDQIKDPIFKRVTYQGSKIDSYIIDKDGHYMVTGSYYTTTADQNKDIYYVDNYQETENGPWNLRIMHATNGVAMKGGRVWIAKRDPSATGAPRLTTVGMQNFVGDADEDFGTSYIEDLVVENDPIERYADDDNVYDLQGRIVGKGSLNGLSKGIYIFHGRKEVVR